MTADVLPALCASTWLQDPGYCFKSSKLRRGFNLSSSTKNGSVGKLSLISACLPPVCFEDHLEAWVGPTPWVWNLYWFNNTLPATIFSNFSAILMHHCHLSEKASLYESSLFMPARPSCRDSIISVLIFSAVKILNSAVLNSTWVGNTSWWQRTVVQKCWESFLCLITVNANVTDR